EGLHMPVEKTLLLLAWKGHDKGFTGKIESHDKDLDGLTNTADHSNGLAPITLRILARLIFQGNIEVRRMMDFVPFANKFAHVRLTACVAFRLNDLKNLMR